MNEKKQVLLLIGSPRPSRSTSESLGTYLLNRLHENGIETETLIIHRSLKSDEQQEALLSATDRADLIILAFPLYVDSLPALVIKTLELIAKRRQTRQISKKQGLLCIVNNGFPEAHQNDTALAICRRFAREAKFEWSGGLALGGGGAIDGKPLVSLRGMVRNVRKSLDLTADALIEDKPVPQEAVELMAKPLIPAWIYRMVGSFGWKRQAKKHGAHKKLDDRPYQQSHPS